MTTLLRNDVSLEAITERHAAAMFQWMSQPEIAENIGLLRTPSLKSTLEWIESASSNPQTIARAVIVKQRHVGNVTLDQLSPTLGTARLSIYIGERTERGSGVGTTAIGQLLMQAFSEHKVHKVWLLVRMTNTAALRTYSRIGFKIEGILQDELLVRGRRESAIRMGLISSDFLKRAFEPSPQVEDDPPRKQAS